jgi:hypothetical protein
VNRSKITNIGGGTKIKKMNKTVSRIKKKRKFRDEFEGSITKDTITEKEIETSQRILYTRNKLREKNFMYFCIFANNIGVL